MDITEVKGWLGNGDVIWSVLLVLEMPAFNDSITLSALTNKSQWLYSVNNYGGPGLKEYLTGNLSIVKHGNIDSVRGTIHLFTKHPVSQQQIVFTQTPIKAVNFFEYQKLEDKKNSSRKAGTDNMVNALTEIIMVRDSIWQAEKEKIADSLKQHPYTGKFTFRAQRKYLGQYVLSDIGRRFVHYC